MVFEGGIDGEIDVVETKGAVDEVFKEKDGAHCRVGSRINRNSLTFEGGKEVGSQVRGCGVSHPDALWK